MRVFHGNNPGDSVGNRRSIKDIRIPNDDVGNHLEVFRTNENTPDNLGNSVDIAPTHQLSGITYRKKSDAAPLVRMGKYLVGGVNPAVAGLAHLIPEPPAPPAPQENSGAPAAPATDKRLRRLFEFDEDDRVEYTLSSTPEEKRAQAESAVNTIFETGSLTAEITATLEESEEKSSVLVLVNSPVFKTGELPLAALNFLVNKIVNRLPSDRIRLAVRAPS
ncbi:MAG: hypothetical protein WCK49_02325 [Myxococcaceae bacterium]